MSENIRLSKFADENKNALESLGMEIRKQLAFIEQSIKEDRQRLEAYKARHGDLNYRPKEGSGFGKPTELVLKPLVNEYRQTIKSLLDSLTLIEVKLGVDTGKGEGSSGISGEYVDGEEQEENFNAKAWLRTSKGKNKGGVED